MDIQKLLKQKGYRITAERQHVIKVLCARPLSVQEIYIQLKKKNIKIDLTSVYRSLCIFVELGIVRALELGEGKKRYELVDERNHHHHLICSKCKDIEDIFIEEKSLMREVEVKSKFKIDNHHLEFFGLCFHCQ